MEQKSLIALLVLIAVVSTTDPKVFTVNNPFYISRSTLVNPFCGGG
ncbi:ribose ABC transporter permease, partial [Klebsiella pneumoniae]|nr:ribose ABC transporter permease [Klebsiella pneumoniae]